MLSARRLGFASAFLACNLYITPVGAIESGLLVAAQNMITSGQSLQALELLSPLEEEHAGDRDYDYLYGLALLDTGEPASAVFAFQRALAVDPNFAGARMELARAFFDMGQLLRAQREFLILQSQSPPENVVQVIEKYLAAIENLSLSNRRGWTGFLELGVGSDSNANAATAADEFLGFTLSDDSRETASSVISTLGGARYDLPLTFDSKFYFSGSINHRANSDASFTSTVNYDLIAGYSKSFSNRNDFSTSFQLYSADVDGDFNNMGMALSGQYNFNLSPGNQIGTFLRVGSVDYDSDFDVKDIDQTLYGVNWARVFGGSTRISMVVAAIFGRDDAVESDSPYSRDYTGLRLSVAYPFSHRFNVFSSIGSADSEFDDAFFGDSSERSDTFSDFSFGASWQASKTWTLRAVLAVFDSSSNVDLYDYDRDLILITARSEFLP